MADKRIYELTDTQSSYDKDIVLATDDATFTNTKKIAIGTIYPKTNTLSSTGNYNPTTTLFRMDNGSGSESKLTVKDMLEDTDTIALQRTALGLDSSSISFTGLPATGITVTELNGVRSYKTQVITGRITNAASTNGVESLIQTIANYNSPGHNVYFAFQCTINANEGAYGRIATNGQIFITAFNDLTWAFNVTIIGS